MFRFSLAFSTLLLAAAPPAAQAEPVLAVVAPASGPFAALGAQVFAGAERLAGEKKVAVTRIPENCEPGGGEKVAAAIVAAKAAAAVGFLCAESLEGGAERLKAAGIPALSVSVRSKILFEDARKEDWPVFTLAPRFEDEADTLASVIVERWQGSPFALIDDGTLPARELVEAVRSRLEERGLKAQFADTFRPGLDSQLALVRRLAKVGVTHVLIGGDRNDAAIVARDAAAENILLALLGSEALNAANQPLPLADGVEAVLLPETPPGAEAVAEALVKAGVVVEGYVLPAYAAATIAVEAMRMAASGRTAAAVMTENSFDTALGPFAFGKDAPRRNRYVLMKWQGDAFVPAEAGP